MKKLILLLLLAFTLMSSALEEQYGEYIIFSNDTYRAVRLYVYHYENAQWNEMGSVYIVAQSSKVVGTPHKIWNRYGYSKNDENYITTIYTQHVRIY